MSHHFLAMMHRMRYINRWSLMRNTQPENIQEHSLQVAMVAHALAEIRIHMFSENRPAVNREEVVLLSLYHDAGEILTGDLPTPVKYANPAIRDAYKAVETVAAEKLLSLLPDELKDAYRPLFLPDQHHPPSVEAMKLVKAADRISAYIKCLDEKKAGNTEFRQAERSVYKTLVDLANAMPEVDWFMKHLLPSFELSLDELS
jgi:5'-deoxynucleotidase